MWQCDAAGDEDGFPILQGVNLTIRAGEVHAIMGTNGSGKSTLSKVLVGHPDYEVTGGSGGQHCISLSRPSLTPLASKGSLFPLFRACMLAHQVICIANFGSCRVHGESSTAWPVPCSNASARTLSAPLQFCRTAPFVQPPCAPRQPCGTSIPAHQSCCALAATFKGQDLLSQEPEDRARAGLFMSFQTPVEIPGVSNAEFLRLSCNARRKAQGHPELEPLEFYGYIQEKVSSRAAAGLQVALPQRGDVSAPCEDGKRRWAEGPSSIELDRPAALAGAHKHAMQAGWLSPVMVPGCSWKT